MKNITKIVALLMALAMTFCIASCGESGNTTSTASEAGTASAASEETITSAESKDEASSEVSDAASETPVSSAVASEVVVDQDPTAPATQAAVSTANALFRGKYTTTTAEGIPAYDFSYGSSGIDVNFHGTELWMYLPEVPMEKESVRKVGVAVVVDSDYAMDATMITLDRNGWVCVAKNLADGDHSVKIRKQSRGFFGIMASDWFRVSKIATDGSFLAPDKTPSLVIEVYGDSISNGDAVWLNEDGSNSAYTYGNWTGVLERLLSAEVKVCGNTGNGLLGWVMAEKNGKADNLLPPQNNWNKIDENHSNTPYKHEGVNVTDVVIINLGTNDRVELGNGDITDTQFEDEYIRFIKQIKADCPDAIVIATVGAMGLLKGDNYDVDFKRICDECNKAASKDYVYYLELVKGDNIIGGLGWDNGHPSNVAGEVYGLQLANIINKRLNLGISLPKDIPASAYERKVDTKDVCLSGTAFDSGIEVYGDHIAANVNDGNSSTQWQGKDNKSVGIDCWVGVKFAKTASITNIEILWETDTRASASTSGYYVQYSTDNGSTWKDFKNIKYKYDTSTAKTNTDVVTFDKTSCNAIRVVCLDTVSDKYAPSIFNLKAAGDDSLIPEGNLLEYITGRKDMISLALALVK